MANAYYVLYSRDPHLAAIGFVWNPLPSVSVMPFLLLKGVWFPLASHDMAGARTSAICMTGAVHQLRSTFREWGLARITRLTIVALFALNPMILYYSGNGMSEALYLFTLLAVTRYLSRWLVTDELSSLVYAAAALGLAYLAGTRQSDPPSSPVFLSLELASTKAARLKRSDHGSPHGRHDLSPSLRYLLPRVGHNQLGYYGCSLRPVLLYLRDRL